MSEQELKLPDLNIQSFIEKTILVGIVFVLALPLLGDYGLWLFPIGRDVIFKLSVELLIVLAIMLWSLKIVPLRGISRRGKNLKTIFSPIAISLLSFWVIMALATIFSVQSDFSLWGNIYKNQGLITWTHYLLFFFLLVGFLRNKAYWRILLNIAVAIASLVSLIALWQVLGSGISFRASATLNNSNYLAAYLILLAPLTFSMLIKHPSFFLGIASFLQIFALLATQTRGGYLGLAIVMVVFAVLYLRRIRGLPKTKLLLWVAGPILLLLTTYYLLLTTNAGQSFQQKLPDFTDRFSNYQNISSDYAPRLEAWQAGWHGMLEKPMLGYGPENFFVAYDSFYSGSLDNTGSLASEGSLWESWFDKAHNFIFDIGATMGFLGLFAYSAIFSSALYLLSRKLSIIKIGIIAALSGYLAQNLLGFDTIVPGIYLMFFLAYSSKLGESTLQQEAFRRPSGHGSAEEAESEAENRTAISSLGKLTVSSWVKYFLPAILMFLLFIIFIASIKIHTDMLKANHELNLAEKLVQTGRINQGFAAFEKGLEYNSPPINPNLRRRYAVIALAYYDAVEKNCKSTGSDPVDLSDERCEKLFDDSEKYLARALELQKENAAAEWPRFTRNYIYAAQISHILGNYEESDAFFEKALELSPTRASIYKEWARLLEERGNIEKSKEKLNAAQEINKAIR